MTGAVFSWQRLKLEVYAESILSKYVGCNLDDSFRIFVFYSSKIQINYGLHFK